MRRLGLSAKKKKQPKAVTGTFAVRFSETLRGRRTGMALGTLLILVLAVVVPVAIFRSFASTGAVSFETEGGSLSGPAFASGDGSASSGSYIQFASTSSGGGTSTGGTDHSCVFSGNAVAAMCDGFNAPAGTGNRSGQLNGVLWGVSRLTSTTNFGQGQNDVLLPSRASVCDTSPRVSPNDVQICNGQFVETMDDGGHTCAENCGNQVVWAAYPKQPFDFNGRTGKVVFDVGDDTEGGHAAWPGFALTDLPVPAPYEESPGLEPYAQNSFGFTFGYQCGPGTGATCSDCNSNVLAGNVTDAWVTTNYVLRHVTAQRFGCVKQPTQTGQLNHFELTISQNEIDLYGTDAGASPTSLKLLAKFSGVNLSFTRGFIWMEDSHYNACKYDTQCNHSFIWDNVGFDGPVLPRDLSFDVLDNGIPGNVPVPGAIDLGWRIGPGESETVHTVGGMTAANIAAAEKSILTLSIAPDAGPAPVLSYSLNGHPAHTFVWPATLGANRGFPSIAVPVPLNELVPGPNSITFTASAVETIISNIDIKLAGAGGIAHP